MVFNQTTAFSREKLLFFAFFLLISSLRSQVTCDPAFPSPTGNVTIFYDATQGNGALAGQSTVFIHTGVITNLSTGPSDWKHVATTWAVSNSASTMTNVSPNIWKKDINISQFYGLTAGETVLKMAFVFRNASGSIVGRACDGADMYYDVFPANSPLATMIWQPSSCALLKNIGETFVVKAVASQTASLSLIDNGQVVANANGTSLETNVTVSEAGLHEVLFVANTSNASDTSKFVYVVPEALSPQDPPAGTELGYTVLATDSIRLALYAPGKSVVFALGDFNDWLAKPGFQMRKSIDGKTWWIDIGGLTPGQLVRYQYLVDGNLRVADPYSALVLDPWNDPFISPLTFPNLPAYPTGKTAGVVTVVETNPTPFEWTATNYVRPKKTDLTVYELLVRDFVARHDFQTILDTLDYLQRLGVNALEFMPVNEFDGNINWGYGPSFHKALDKYYGDPKAFKTLIDECHKRGMAVIVDVVYNHATGGSPLAQLYWDSANNRPAADNPWLNPTAKHDFNVFNDFNHDSPATKYYVKNTLNYWLEEFKIDGFRFDLSKGFTQKLTVGNIGAWGAYDAARIATLKDYSNSIWAVDPTAYIILEHFADNTEEKELAEFGAMLWGNSWGSYKDVALGLSSAVGASLTGVNYKTRNWTKPHLIGYMESHDEDRIAYECKTYGNSVAGYDIKSLPIAMKRIELNSALFYTVPGPKMLWQFGEVGYDFPINYCENGTINQNCRTSPKPIRWDYQDDPYRKRLYNVTRALIHLRNTLDLLETTDFQLNTGSGKGRTIRLNSPTLKMHVVANIATTTENITPNFQNTGTWYEYFTGQVLDVTTTNAPLSLQPGEYRIYFNELVPLPAGLIFSDAQEPTSGALRHLEIYPNPTAGWLNIDFELKETQGLVLEVSTLTGTQVETQQFENVGVGYQQINLDVTAWPAGVYFVSLRGANGNGLVKKVVKQ
jgi:glycosidase